MSIALASSWLALCLCLQVIKGKHFFVQLLITFRNLLPRDGVEVRNLSRLKMGLG